MNYKYPVYKPYLSGNEKTYVLDCIDSSWISSKGEYITRFESEFRNYVGSAHALSVCNGTVAIHLAMAALGIGPGDEVIVPTFTYVASVNPVHYCGATPVFVDSLADTWQIDPADVQRKITNRTKAIVCVHLYGHSCDMIALRKIATENSLFLIEDCAEGFGTRCQGRHVGTVGDIGTFSFFGNKTITTGEGGMVTTNDKTLYERALHLRGQGLAKHRQYWHDVIGYNYRMTNICAAIGLAQLEQASQILERKLAIAKWYKQFLEGAPVKIHRQADGTTHSYWMVTILVEAPEEREPLRNHLAACGIETRPTFYPVHTMPMYSAAYQKHPIAEYIGWRGINVPSYPALNSSDVEFISSEIRNYFKAESPRHAAPIIG
jgi:perosamine synthetase